MNVDEATGLPSPDDQPGRAQVRGSTNTRVDDPEQVVTAARSAESPDPADSADPADSDPPALEPILTDLAAAAEMEAEPAKRRDLTTVRRVALLAWAAFMVLEIWQHGLAFDRTRLIVLLCLGLIAASIGRRKVTTVFLDWAPFALILVLYDWTRNVAQLIDMPTQWFLAADADKAMFGVVPTVWLQDHLKEPTAPWWEVVTALVYMSYFVVPYAVAAVLWLRDRSAWRRFAACFVATTFLGLVGYTLIPAAPPWAAARCTAVEVADHPREAACMVNPQASSPGGILGPLANPEPGAEPYVERISARGWDYLNIHVASSLVEIGQGKSNLVAAIPSLHAGLTMLLALFMWPRLKALGRTLFMGYAVAMAFTLVYTAEHYVFDIILGWALAAFVITVYQLIDRKILIPRQQRRAALEPEPTGDEPTAAKPTAAKPADALPRGDESESARGQVHQ